MWFIRLIQIVALIDPITVANKIYSLIYNRNELLDGIYKWIIKKVIA